MVSRSSFPGPQEALFRLMFEQAPGFIVVLEGPTHVFKLANAAYMELVGAREIIGKPVAEALPESVPQGFIDLLDRVLATGVPYVGRRVPLNLQRTAGTPGKRYIDFVYQPIFHDGGQAAGIFVQGNDVTDHVLAELQLKEETERRLEQYRVFDSVLESIEDFTYTFDRARRFIYVNKPLLDLWGKSLADVVGLNFFELDYSTELATRLDQEIERVFDTGERVRNETYYKSPTGKDGWFEYVFSPVRDAAGEIATVAGSTRDITSMRTEQERLSALNDAERAARAQAEFSSKMKDQFLATLSHELRTPLNAMLGWAELLNSGRLPPERVPEAAARILRNVKSQAQLVDDLLDMNGIISGKVSLAVDAVPLSRPLLAAIEAVRPEAVRRGVSLNELTWEMGCQVDCDPERLQQVFWNLLANAIKFTPASGTVSVGVERDGDVAVVKITDTGVGIDASFLPQIFERFSQGDSSTTRRFGGLGLGLSISRNLVEMQGGSISAISSGQDAGSTFTVRMPMVRSALSAEPSSNPTEPSVLPSDDELIGLSDAKVLIVDDDAESLLLLATLLADYGAQVFTASSGADALAQLETQVADLLLCDIGMPDMDGYEMIRRLRRFSDVPAVAITAFAREEDKAAALSAGFQAHIAKPAAPGKILSVCSEVLAVRDGRDRAPASS